MADSCKCAGSHGDSNVQEGRRREEGKRATEDARGESGGRKGE